MTLPTEHSLPPPSVGAWDGGGDSCKTGGGIVALDSRVEFPQFCERCDCEQTFVAAWECDLGLLGCCQGCGEERVARFTRENSEVA